MNFNDVLNTPVEDIKRPPLPPIGTYKFSVTKVPAMREVKSNKNGEEKVWDVIEFPLRATAPGDDVDIEHLRDFGDLKNINQQKSFMFPRGDEAGLAQALFNLKRFVIEHLNVEWPDGTPVKAILPKVVGAVCMGNIQYEPDNRDPEVMYARLKSTTSAQ